MCGPHSHRASGNRTQRSSSSRRSIARSIAARNCASRTSAVDAPATNPASCAHWRSISSRRNSGDGSRTPSASRASPANARSRSRVESESPSRVGGASGGSATLVTLIRRPLPADSGSSRTTNDPGVCSRCAATTPRVVSIFRSRRTASRTTGTPPKLWLPRPVMTNASVAPSACRCLSQLSVRRTASVAVGSDDRRFNVPFRPNRSSSSACCRGRRVTRLSASMTGGRGRPAARVAWHRARRRALVPCRQPSQTRHVCRP